MAFSARRERLLLLRDISLRRLLVFGDLVKRGKEVRRPEIIVSNVSILEPIHIVISMSLPVGNMMTILPV